jgi:hypothetical protein
MKTIRTSVGVKIVLLMLPLLAGQTLAEGNAFEQVETKTLDKEKFVFPDDLRGGRLDIVLLAIGEDQDNGTWQGDALLDWYAALDGEQLLSDDVMAWHFSAMKVPFFIKSVIRNGMADEYAGKVPADQSAPLYVKNVKDFASAAGLEIDGKPSILLVSPGGEILATFKGEATPEKVAAVATAVKNYLASGQPATE